MGHRLLNWVSYVHLHLQSVLSDKINYITFIFLIFLTSTSEIVPFMWLSWLLLGIFGSSIYFISNPSPIISKPCRCPCPNWKNLKQYRRCKFYYWLVLCCILRHMHRPPHLDGSFFPSPRCTKYWRQRRRRSHARSFF